jgi:hypothetical protein
MKRQTQSLTLLIGIVSLVACAGMGQTLQISEVAWAGTAAGSSDEWIELRNVSEYTIALAGWRLVFGATAIHLGEVSGSTVEARTASLAPGEFLILERTDDSTISDMDADVLYTGNLVNTGVLIELLDPQGTVVDSVAPCETGWPAGSASDGTPPYCTMERTSDGGWSSNDGVIRNGLDAAGNPLNGTPGQPNSPEVRALCAPSVRLTFPAAEGSTLSGSVLIAWAASDPDGVDSALAIAVWLRHGDEEEWTVLGDNLANTGSFAWDTTAHPTGDAYRILVRAQDPQGYVGEARSPEFAIAANTE